MAVVCGLMCGKSGEAKLKSAELICGSERKDGELEDGVEVVYVPLGNCSFRPTDPRSRGKGDAHRWLANFSARRVIGPSSRDKAFAAA